MPLPFDKPPASICLLRLSSIGDVTHVVPIIHTLHTHWPDTQITWIVGKLEAKLVGELPGVEFIIFEKGRGWRAYSDLKARLAHRQFDVLLHMQVAMRANLASRLVKAPVRIGYDHKRAKDLHGLFINYRIPATPHQHVLDSFFSFLEVLGIKNRDMCWDIPISEESRAFAEHHLPGRQKTLVISPCSSHPSRSWQPSDYAEIADYAVERYRMRIVLCGGSTQIEREVGAAITQKMSYPVIDLIGRDSLKKLLAILDRADILISPDSGPAHMATCVGTLVIGLYAATNPQRSGPYLSRQWCIDKYDHAARRYKNKPAAKLKWGRKLEYPGVMELIKPQEVISMLDRVVRSTAC